MWKLLFIKEEEKKIGDIKNIEGLGWYKLFKFGYGLTVYANGHHRIMIDDKTLEVINTYTI